MTRCHSCGISPSLSGPANLSHLCRSCRNTPPDIPGKRPVPFSRARRSSNHSSRLSSLPPSSPTISADTLSLLRSHSPPLSPLPPPKRRRTSPTPSSPSSSSSSSSSEAPSLSPTPSLSSTPPRSKPLARIVSLGGRELLQLRKERLKFSPVTRRKLPQILENLDVPSEDLEDSLSDVDDNEPETLTVTDEPGQHPGFARLTPTPPKGRHWPGRDTVLAVRRALFLGVDPTEEQPRPLKKRKRSQQNIEQLLRCEEVLLNQEKRISVQKAHKRLQPPMVQLPRRDNVQIRPESPRCEDITPRRPPQNKKDQPAIWCDPPVHNQARELHKRTDVPRRQEQSVLLSRPQVNEISTRTMPIQDRMHWRPPPYQEAAPGSKPLIPPSRNRYPDGTTQAQSGAHRDIILAQRPAFPGVSRPRDKLPYPRETQPRPRETFPYLRETQPSPRETLPNLRVAEPRRRETLPYPRVTPPRPRESQTRLRKTQARQRDTLPRPRETLPRPQVILPRPRETLPRPPQTLLRPNELPSQQMQKQGFTRPLSRALPLTAWPQPRISPRLSSYTFRSALPAGGAIQPARALRSPAQVPASATANREPRQGFIRRRAFKPFRIPLPQRNTLSSHFRPPTFERGVVNRPLFSRQPLENRRANATELKLIAKPGREVSFLRSVPRERRAEKRPLFSPPVLGREPPENVSRSFERPPKHPRTAVDRQKELRKRLAELRLLKAKRISEAEEKLRIERAAAKRLEQKTQEETTGRLPTDIYRKPSFRVTSAERAESWDQIDIARPTSPVTSSGERMRHAVVETRQEWRRNLAAKELPQQALQENYVTSGESPHIGFNNRRRAPRATAIARPRTATLNKQATDPSFGQSTVRTTVPEKPHEERKNISVMPLSPSKPLIKAPVAERFVLQAPEEAQQARSLPDEVTDRSRNNNELECELGAGTADSFDDATSARRLQPKNTAVLSPRKIGASKPVSKHIDDPFGSPCRINSPARYLSPSTPSVVKRQNVVPDPGLAAPTANPTSQKKTIVTSPVIREDTAAPKPLRSFTIKAACRYGWAKSTRRLSIGYNVTFSALKNHLEVAFEMTKPFAITYQDEEGDIVKVSSDAEMTHLLDMARRQKKTMQMKLIPPHGNLGGSD